MEEQLGSAITLMAIGMLTVFFILILVISSAYALVSVLNKTGFVLNRSRSALVPQNNTHNKVIKQAIKQWSKGKAEVKSIKEIL